MDNQFDDFQWFLIQLKVQELGQEFKFLNRKQKEEGQLMNDLKILLI